MTTEQREEWTLDRHGQLGANGVRCWSGDGAHRDLAGAWIVAVADPGGRAHCNLSFQPTPAEARAALRMPAHSLDDNVSRYTREAVHAFMAAEARTEATPSGEPPRAGDWLSAAAPGGGWKLHREADDNDGDHWVRVEAPDGRSLRVYVGGVRGHASKVRRLRDAVRHVATAWWKLPDPYAPAPVQPVEPRRFQPGDHIRDCYGGEHVVTKIEGDRVWVLRPGCAPCLMWWAASDCTLVTPVQQDGEAAPETKALPMVCPRCAVQFGPGQAGIAHGDGVWHWACLYQNGGPLAHRLEQETPYVHEGATLTNPAGFPVMPEPGIACFHCGTVTPPAEVVPVPREDFAYQCRHCARDEADAGREPASVVLPFDAFMAAREREQSEPEPYDPREGDEVEVATDYGSMPGVVVRGSRDRGVTVRVRSTDGHEIVVSESAYYVTLVRRPGGAR